MSVVQAKPPKYLHGLQLAVRWIRLFKSHWTHGCWLAVFYSLHFPCNEGCNWPIPGPSSFTKYLQTTCINPETGSLCATLPCRTIDMVKVVPLTVSPSTAKATACPDDVDCPNLMPGFPLFFTN